MYKKIIGAMFSFAISSTVFAYNPPAGGQNILKITSPNLLTNANSSAGGAIFGATPASVVINPSLTAFNQRIAFDAAGTLLFDADDDKHPFGGAFETGLLIPSKWLVSTFLVQGIFAPMTDMQLGDSFNFTAGVSKDVTDTLSVGTSCNLGLFYGYGNDWMANFSLGAYYNFGNVGFLKDVRFGAVISNLGKMYSNTEVLGIKGSDADVWPALATFRTGTAAMLLATNSVKMGVSLDLAFPTFQNVVADAGFMFQVKDFLKVSTAWEFDYLEYKNDCKNILPSVGIGFKFLFHSNDNSYLTKKGWQQSEMTVSTAYRRMYENVNAYSAGVVLDLGLQDKDAPEVSLWGEK